MVNVSERLASQDMDFAADLFKAADKMGGAFEPSEYKQVALSDDEYADEEDHEE